MPDAEMPDAEMPDTTTTTIDIRDLDIERGHRSVLQIDHLQIAPGYTALVGPNGSGKSTLLHAIAGLLEPTSGQLVVGSSSAGSFRRLVAYVLQSQRGSEHLLVTAREVVGLARITSPWKRLRTDDRRAIDDAMERLDVAHLGSRHLAEMSGGQRQRVFIAQGLAQESDILLLDEPVAGLDLASAQTIRAAVDDERNSGRTVVVATHDLEEAARADHVVMLNGRMIAEGAPADVLTADVLREVYAGRVLDIGAGIVVDDGVHHDHPR